MGFYIRKSVKAGPFRFNLSKSGVRVSVGVPGFRVGTGPRGNYVHMGKNGVYYRATLGSSSVSRVQRQRNELSRPLYAQHVPAYDPNDVVLDDVTGATAMSLEPTGGGDLVEQLNAASTQIAWGWPATCGAFITGFLFPPYSLIFWALLAPLCWWLFLRDQARRTVVLFYDVHDSTAAWFDTLVTQWRWLTACQRLWRVVQSGRVATTYQYKMHSGVGSIVNRITACATMSGPKHLSTNVSIPSLTAGESGLYFLPDRLLVKEGKYYSDVDYQLLSISSSQVHFHESSGSSPGDALQIGHTWQYVNVKGGPDRRFANNPVVPILLYGVLELTSAQGLSWKIQTSNADSAAPIASVLSAVPAVRKAS